MRRAACGLLARALRGDAGLPAVPGVPPATADAAQIWMMCEGRQPLTVRGYRRRLSAVPAVAEPAATAISEQQGAAPPHISQPTSLTTPYCEAGPTDKVDGPLAGDAASSAVAGLAAQVGNRDGSAVQQSEQEQGEPRRPYIYLGAGKQRRPWQERQLMEQQQQHGSHVHRQQQWREQGQVVQSGNEGDRQHMQQRTLLPNHQHASQNKRLRYKLAMSLLHHSKNCQMVVEHLQQQAGWQALGSRELTIACSQLGKHYTKLYKSTRKTGGDADNNRSHCETVFRMVAQRFADLDSQALATAVWMCARFHWLPPPELRAAWEAEVWRRREQFNLIETSNIMFSLGVLHWDPGHLLMVALLDQALQRRQHLTPWMACNMMWGCARMTDFHPGPERLVQMVEAMLPLLNKFAPESFCSLIFSLACLRCRPDDVAMTAILDAFERVLDKSNCRQLVTIVWSMGALGLEGVVTEAMWARINAKALAVADQFNFASTPFFIFGAARLQLPPQEELMRLLLDKAWHFISELRTGDVSVTLWALSRLGHRVGDEFVSQEFVEAMLARFHAHNRERRATLRQLSSLLFSLLNLKFSMPRAVLADFIASIDAVLQESEQPLHSTDASMLLSAFEGFQSVEGLTLLKRHIMGGSNKDTGSIAEVPDTNEMIWWDDSQKPQLQP